MRLATLIFVFSFLAGIDSAHATRGDVVRPAGSVLAADATAVEQARTCVESHLAIGIAPAEGITLCSKFLSVREGCEDAYIALGYSPATAARLCGQRISMSAGCVQAWVAMGFTYAQAERKCSRQLNEIFSHFSSVPQCLSAGGQAKTCVGESFKSAMANRQDPKPVKVQSADNLNGVGIK